jgi:predicted RNA methylase
MLQDSVRMEAFHDAIFSVVQPGDIVIDLGTGTGILAYWAAMAGAKHVYAIEESDSWSAAQAVITSNGLTDRVTVLQSNSTDVQLDEHADVLVSELIGHFLFEEGAVEYIADVRAKLLKPEARIIPAGAKVFIAPAHLGDSFEEVRFWREWHDPDLSVIAEMAADTAYVETVIPSQLLSVGKQIFTVDFTSDAPQRRVATAEFISERTDAMDAIVGWFDLALSPTHHISTAPDAPATHWKQCVFPLHHPVMVDAGEHVTVEITLEPYAPGAHWSWRVASGNSGTFEETHRFCVTHPRQTLLSYETF